MNKPKVSTLDDVDSGKLTKAATQKTLINSELHDNGLLNLTSPVVMGIINVTPDSFSDGDVYSSQNAGVDLDLVLPQVEQMLKDGATIIDVGGESTRPGARAVTLEEEASRVLPVVEAICQNFGCAISVDTSTPMIMTEAAALGASMINDVRALSREGALEAAAQTGLPICLMHMQGQPTSMQEAPEYVNVIDEVFGYLDDRIRACEKVGIPRRKVFVDPGFGFGKTLEHNLSLVQHLSYLQQLDCSLLVGFSRKSMIGKILDEPIDKRLYGGLALTMMALERGAKIIRVHDVKPTVDAVKVFQAVMATDC